ncbi:MAG: hypothetical protein OHK0040_06380 [bacterium]
MKSFKIAVKSLIKKGFFCIVFMSALLLINAKTSFGEGGKWLGVDEAVVEKYAKKFGVEPREPYINTDQGDLLLFIFTLAGATGGFVMGYNFRKIFKEKKSGSLS